MSNVFIKNIQLINKVEIKKPTPKEIFAKLLKSLICKGGTLFLLQTFSKLEKRITNECCRTNIKICSKCLDTFLNSINDISILFREYAFITIESIYNPKILISLSLFRYKDINLHANIEYCSKEFLELLIELNKNNSFRRISRSSYGTLIKYDDFEYNDIFNIFINKKEFISILLHCYICTKLCYLKETEHLFSNYVLYLRDKHKRTYKFIDNLYDYIKKNRNIFLETEFISVLLNSL